MIVNLAFYKFCRIDAPDALRDALHARCRELGVRGTILLAHEGINAMVAAPREAADAFASYLREDSRFADLTIKRSFSDEIPFERLVVRVKPEIVTMRVEGVDAVSKTAPHLAPEEFQKLLREEQDVVVIDTRNDFEYRLGTFRGAINPDTRAFHEFPEWVEAHREELEGKKVLMFCTGGIRCEKATSWMLDRGFEDVYQLEGGVLNYFERVETAQQDWDGELFVFDKRVGIDTRLSPTGSTLCESCGAPIRKGVERLCDCAP